MIQRLRGLGLGLFPPEGVPANVEEAPAVLNRHAPCDGSNGCSNPGLGRSSRKSYGIELFEAECRKELQGKEKEMAQINQRPCQFRAKDPMSDSGLIEDADALNIQDGELLFRDEDELQVVQKRKRFGSLDPNVRGKCYVMFIPKRKMACMPPKAPASYVTLSSSPQFFIRVLMVEMSDTRSVDIAIDWLLPDQERETGHILGLACELNSEGTLSLIQLSMHQKCVVIQVLSSGDSSSSFGCNPDRLTRLLETTTVVKTGIDMEDDVLAIYWATGMVVNSCKNIAEVYLFRQRPMNMISIFRKLYNWNWSRREEITKSDWGLPTLSPKQIKYAIMEAWASRMIALDGRAAVQGAVTIMSIANIPLQVLDLFGRALADAARTDDSVSQETLGMLRETSLPGTLELYQKSYRSRIKGKCVIEMQFKEDVASAHYQVQCRKGKAVILAPRQKPAKGEKKKVDGPADQAQSQSHDSGQKVSLESIKSLTVVEKFIHHSTWQRKHLWEALKSIVRKPAACPKHLLLALGCSGARILTNNDDAQDFEDLQSFWTMTPELDLRSEPYRSISQNLNESQREAWKMILTTPLSATIGPPGTGKTSLITAVAKSWIAGRGDEDCNEVLLCTAYQNVAVRHLAETLMDDEVPGVLLLISEDYYRGWNEGFYTQLSECLVVSTSDQGEFSSNLSCWRTRNERNSSPNILVCTVDMVGCPSFLNGLMKGKVTALIIDESSQASDVSLLRPLVILPDLAMVSVLGDPNQLPPYSANRGEQSVPSVFDLVSTGCEVNFLREQYRMPTEICDFLSSEIYDNVLVTAPHRRKEKDRSPLVWAHVRGSSTSMPGKTSLYNAAEASAILRFSQILVTKMGVDCDRIVVLTLYEEQTRRIADDLAASGLEIPVHNVDSFQGQQCDIVLISLVVGRSFSPFAADQRRACVMMSRVRRFLCVFGDHDEVKRNHQAGLWMKLANHCKKRSLVVDEDKIESFLGAGVEEAKVMWQKHRPQKNTLAQELLSDGANPEAAPAVGISVQVMFKAR